MERCTEMKGRGGDFFFVPSSKKKKCVCVGREKEKGRKKKKEMGQNKPQKMEFSLEKLERNSSTPCALYMLTEGLL